MLIQKVIKGKIVQVWDTDKEVWVSQHFVGDEGTGKWERSHGRRVKVEVEPPRLAPELVQPESKIESVESPEPYFEEKSDKKPVGSFLAVFNGHVNDAFNRTKEAFIVKWGHALWEQEITPYWEKGIMSLFYEKPNEYLVWYVEKITEIVNENRQPVQKEKVS